MEIERSVDYSKSGATNRPSNPGARARTQRQEAQRDPNAVVANLQGETDGWVVLGVDRSYFRERLIAFDYTPAITPAQLVKTAHLDSREQLDELV